MSSISVSAASSSRVDTAVIDPNKFEDMLMAAHLRGYHPYGQRRQACPICKNIEKLEDSSAGQY